jgi:hypothetical protein
MNEEHQKEEFIWNTTTIQSYVDTIQCLHSLYFYKLSFLQAIISFSIF